MSTGAFRRRTGTTRPCWPTRASSTRSRVANTRSTTQARTCTWSCCGRTAPPTGSSTRSSTRSRTRRCWRLRKGSHRCQSRLLGMAASRKIGVFGAGWVGLVTGGCLAELGHDVVVRDVLPERIEALRAGRVPFHEPDLPEVLERNRELIRYTLDAEDLAEADVLFICVQTPPTYSGDADLSYVWTALDDLPRVERRRVLVMKSTVPVGTGEKVRAALEARGLSNVGYVSNPEFLAEGRAVHDFVNPDRIVIGSFAEEDGAEVQALYEGIDAPVVVTDVASAEMIKLAANAFLVTRISFINEIANVCEAVGADVVEVAKGVGLDHRLGSHFLRAGIGYGGSCLPGDETVLVSHNGRIRLVGLEQLYAEVQDQDELKVAAWDTRTGRTCLADVETM